MPLLWSWAAFVLISSWQESKGRPVLCNKICELLLMTEMTKNLSHTSYSFTAASLCIKAPNHPSVHARKDSVSVSRRNVDWVGASWKLHGGLQYILGCECLWFLWSSNHRKLFEPIPCTNGISDVDSKSAWWHHCITITMMPSCSLCMANVPRAQWL